MAEEQQCNERACRCYAVAASVSEFCDDPCRWKPEKWIPCNIPQSGFCDDPCWWKPPCNIPQSEFCDDPCWCRPPCNIPSQPGFCDDPCWWKPPCNVPQSEFCNDPCWCRPPCNIPPAQPPPPPTPPPPALPPPTPPPRPSSHPPHKPSYHPPHPQRKKWARYIIPSLIVLTAVIVSIALTVTVMKFRTPKFQIPSAEFERFEINPSNPSFNFRLNAKVRVKSQNFGTYEFDATIVFCYRGVQVGEVAVFMSKANRQSAKNLKVTVDLVTPAVVDKESLATDLSIGVLPLTVVVEIEGQVTILFFKKKKSAKICCDMEINTRAGMVQSINCK